MKTPGTRLAAAALFLGGVLIAVLTMAPTRVEAQSQQELDAAASSDDDWLITNKDYAGHRFVNLRQIDRGNVSKLKAICTYESGVTAPSQTSPLIYKGTMYLTVGYLTAAIDASDCREIWRHVWTPTTKELSDPTPRPESCCIAGPWVAR